MSKSKIMPREARAEKRLPAAAALRRAFVGGDGCLCAPWLLAIGYAAYVLWAWGISYGLSAAFSALFEVWGVNAMNLHLAPAWARFVVNHYGSAISFVSSAGVIAIVALLLRFLLREKGKTRFSARDFGLGSAAGAVVVAVSAGLFLLIDSMRLAAPAAFGADIIVFLPVYIAAACAEEAFCRAFVLKAIVREGNGNRAVSLIACIVSAVILALTTGAFSLGVLGAVNMLLIGFVCACLHRMGHAWTSVGFRFAWSWFSVAIFNFPGGNAAAAPMLSLYHVSDAWLTGGTRGLICGAWMTVLILAVAAALVFIGKRKTPT